MTDTEWKGSWYYDSFFETAQILRISCGLVRSRKTDADQVTQSPQIHLGTAALGCPGELPRQY